MTRSRLASILPAASASVVWPDEDQKLLLRAALADRAEAHLSYARWCRRHSGQTICVDYASFRLLPLVYRNLSRNLPSFPHVDQLRALYRLAWRDGEKQRRGAAQAAATLVGGGIAAMVSKGCVLATDFYDAIGERPSSDCDLYVPENQFEHARDLLIAGGWVPDPNVRPGQLQDRISWGKGLMMQHPVHGEIDLHSRLIQDSRLPEIEKAIRAKAEPYRLGGVEILRPATTHLLLHVLVHGLRPDFVATLRWITDLATIIRRDHAAIDWEEFWSLARKARVVSRIRHGLGFWQEMFPAQPLPVPKASCWNWLEWLEAWALQRRPGRTTPNSLLTCLVAQRLRSYGHGTWADRRRWLRTDLGNLIGRLRNRTPLMAAGG